MATGLALQALGLGWSAAVMDATLAYSSVVLPFVIAGIGVGMFFAPLANVILGSVRSEEEGKASGANSAVREVGGVLGVAVLASIFASTGGYSTPETFVDGLVPATFVGAAVVAIGALLALAVPRLRRRELSARANPELAAAVGRCS
jgi:MFS family permease